MTRIEHLEPRRLFATLAPDFSWADDGAIDRSESDTFFTSSGDGFIAFRYGDDRESGQSGKVFIRYTAAGVPDAGFTPVVSVNNGSNVVADAGGQLYTSPYGRDKNVLRFSRYSATGRLDRSLGDNGTVAIKANALASEISGASALVAVAPTADGGLYVAASYVYSDKVRKELRGHSVIEVFKLDADGMPTQSFGENGRLTYIDSSFNDSATWLATDSAGRLLVGLNDFAGTTVRRYTGDAGALDLTFGNKHGQLLLDHNSGREGLLIDAQDRILARGGAWPEVDDEPSSPAVFTLTRFSDGRADSSYGQNGVFKLTDASAPDEVQYVSPLLPQRNGKLMVQVNHNVYRVAADGRLDRTYDGDGMQSTGRPRVVGQLRDGTLLASPASTPLFGITVTRLIPQTSAARLGKSGTLYVVGSLGRDEFRLRSSGNSIAFDSGGRREAVFRKSAVKTVFADLDNDNDTFDGAGLVDAVVPMHIVGGAGDNRITTGGGRDIVSGDLGDDTIVTGAGKDYVDAGLGSNVINTGVGNDFIQDNAGRETINAGSGDDVIDSDASAGSGPYLGDRIDLGAGNDNAYLDGGDNTVLGGDGDDTLRAGYGRDSIDGGAGRDLIFGGYLNDTLIGGPGRDRLYGGEDDDRLVGGPSDDVLTGGPGKDTLFGEGGNDTLIGGPNADEFDSFPIAINRLDGGAGTDRYQTESDDDVLERVETRIG